jgi:hypothetical protein
MLPDGTLCLAVGPPRATFYCERFEREELLMWLDSQTLEEELDSVLAVVWLLALT